VNRPVAQARYGSHIRHAKQLLFWPGRSRLFHLRLSLHVKSNIDLNFQDLS
jgi:hypothetical protein